MALLRDEEKAKQEVLCGVGQVDRERGGAPVMGVGDSSRTEASSPQMTAWIHEKLLDDSLTELNQAGTGLAHLLPPGFLPWPVTHSQAQS